MSKLIKRQDGSYSKRGLWDNIRKNKGSGKKPTKDMLKQESKIKKEENMKSMYKAGGKTSKPKMKKPMPSFMEESKEMEFGAPGVKPPMKKTMGGMMKYEKGGAGPGKGLFDKIDATTNALYQSAAAGKANKDFDKATSFKTTSPEALEKLNTRVEAAEINKKYAIKKAKEMKKGGFPDLNKDGKTTFADVLESRLKGKEKMMGGKMKEGGAMSKFKTMAAAGKKKMMGGKKC